MDFAAMDLLIQQASTTKEKTRIYLEIMEAAKRDPIFREGINQDKFWETTMELGSCYSPPEKLRVAILGYATSAVGTWDPFSTETGLPGSEECVVYASEELASRNCSVTIYMNPGPNSIWRSPLSNPRWLPVQAWNITTNPERYDLVLMWRRYDVETGRRRGKKVFFWPHDSPQAKLALFPPFDGNCFLSEHHRRQFQAYEGLNNIPYVICGNGILLKHFSSPMRATNPYSVGYFSNYSRGLETLMEIWPKVKEEFPTATLSICYGRETWGTISEQAFTSLINKITTSEGVVEHGKVGHLELAEIMQNTSIWTYPCNTNAETFCITAIKCQAAGCIPVTTRIGALDETVHKDAPRAIIGDSEDYKKILLLTLGRIRNSRQEEIRSEREKYITFSHQYTWKTCVDSWFLLYDKVSR